MINALRSRTFGTSTVCMCVLSIYIELCVGFLICILLDIYDYKRKHILCYNFELLLNANIIFFTLIIVWFLW